MNLFIRLLRIRIKIIRLQDFANFDLDHTGTETQKRGKNFEPDRNYLFQINNTDDPFFKRSVVIINLLCFRRFPVVSCQWP